MTDAMPPESVTDTEPRPGQVVRSVDIDATVDDVWHALTDPAELAGWLDAEVSLDLEPGAVGRVVEPDGTVRQVLVTDVEPGHRLAWHWWEDGGELSTVEITALPLDDGTRVRVVETPAGAGGSIRAQASVASGARSPEQRWHRSLEVVGRTATTLVASCSPRW
jgi:uncharacterized protein YndB with AHSA1/START domain